VADTIQRDPVSLWLRGGYPDAYSPVDDLSWQHWHEGYLRTLLERDLARASGRVSTVQMRRLMGMLAHHHGGLLNLSELGRSLGIHYHTVQRCLDLLEGFYLLRRLAPFHANIGKRLVKSPKVYLRDSGMLHYLLGVSNERGLLESPKRGASFEGFLIEQISALESLIRPMSRSYFFKTHAGAEIDLVIDMGDSRIGYEIKTAASVGRNDLRSLRAGLDQGIIDQGFVVYLGERSFEMAERINVIPAAELLEQLSSSIAR
jgi:predicted AAA+ superfamily ATPase